jgi:hypothetical protein
MVTATDARMRDRQHRMQRSRVDAYVQSRAATAAYSAIFADPLLATDRPTMDVVDGISNTELQMLFGTSSSAREIRLALRLFRFGCPAVYLDQGGYDYHSGEQDRLPGSMEALNHLISALIHVLPRMTHPDGGTYWDHTLVVLGSEFSRTARGDPLQLGARLGPQRRQLHALDVHAVLRRAGVRRPRGGRHHRARRPARRGHGLLVPRLAQHLDGWPRL